MTNSDFSVRSARDEMRLIGRNVIIVSDKDQKRGCRRKDKDNMELLCELHEAQAPCGRCFVHEQPSASENEVCDVDHCHARSKKHL